MDDLEGERLEEERAKPSASVARRSIAGKRWRYCSLRSPRARASLEEPVASRLIPMHSLITASSSSHAAAFSRYCTEPVASSITRGSSPSRWRSSSVPPPSRATSAARARATPSARRARRARRRRPGAAAVDDAAAVATDGAEQPHDAQLHVLVGRAARAQPGGHVALALLGRGARLARHVLLARARLVLARVGGEAQVDLQARQHARQQRPQQRPQLARAQPALERVERVERQRLVRVAHAEREREHLGHALALLRDEAARRREPQRHRRRLQLVVEALSPLQQRLQEAAQHRVAPLRVRVGPRRRRRRRRAAVHLHRHHAAAAAVHLHVHARARRVARRPLSGGGRR